MEKKFNFPNLGNICMEYSYLSDEILEIRENISKFLNWVSEFSEEENNIKIPTEIILDQIFNRLISIGNSINETQDEFPSMNIDEWNKFEKKFDEFLLTCQDLKLNKN